MRILIPDSVLRNWIPRQGSIIHDGALFKIYAAKREVEKEGMGTVTGSGNVLYGEAVDWQGNPVADADGRRILYPRVGKNNGSTDDLLCAWIRMGFPSMIKPAD